jgi:hypothetical protein
VLEELGLVAGALVSVSDLAAGVLGSAPVLAGAEVSGGPPQPVRILRANPQAAITSNSRPRSVIIMSAFPPRSDLKHNLARPIAGTYFQSYESTGFTVLPALPAR